MKKCVIGLLPKLIASAIIICFFLPETFAALYLFLSSEQSPPRLRLLYLLGVLVFGGVLVYSVYRMLVRGLVWVEYDEETVIFHYSRMEEYAFKWEDVPGERIQVQPDGRGYLFCIEGDWKDRKIPVNHASRGFRELKGMLEAKGVLKRAGFFGQEDIQAVYRQLHEMMEGTPRPKPEGGGDPCPDCGGTGRHMKKSVIPNLQIAEPCKTCGGTGYLSKE